jgi:hypothetical protein
MAKADSSDGQNIKEIDVHVLIMAKRLQYLEDLEKNLPNLIDEAIIEYKKAKLKMLHEKDKQNPEAVNARVKRYNEKHKHEISARRIEKRNETKRIKDGNTIDTIIIPFDTNIKNNEFSTIANDMKFTLRF